jgi:hypothetical protein
MKGIPREVAEHKLNIKPGSKPLKNSAFAASTTTSAR